MSELKVLQTKVRKRFVGVSLWTKWL